MLKSFLKILYGLFILVIGTGISVYFVSLAVSDDHEIVETEKTQSFFKDYVNQIETTYDSFDGMESHFHTVNTGTIPAIENHEVCIRCHSPFPHELKKKTRSFNNQHSTFLSCQSCHIEATHFEWVNILEKEEVELDESSELIQSHNELNLTDLFIHKIVPFRQDKAVIEYYNESKYLNRFSQIKSQNDPAFTSVREEAEINLINNPKTCTDCHSQETTFPWDQLKYSSATIDEMKNNAVVNMVTKYDTFHFPKSE